MQRLWFSKEEAESKIGRRIRTVAEFSGVPKGTTGRVVALYEASGDGYSVEIEWDLPRRRQALRDGFTKDEYERFLVEE